MEAISYRSKKMNNHLYYLETYDKPESIFDENLIYCFVHFKSVDKSPKFF